MAYNFVVYMEDRCMNLLSWVFFFCTGGLVTIAMVFGFKYLSRFRWRTIDDVCGLMRPPDQKFLREWSVQTTNVSVQSLFKRLLDLHGRRDRRVLLDRLEEQYRRCYHNSLVIRDWALTEASDMRLFNREGYDNNAQKRIEYLVKKSNASFWDLRGALVAMSVWGLIYTLRLDCLCSLPEPASLRFIWGRDILASYEELKDAVAGMGTIYSGDTWCAQIIADM